MISFALNFAALGMMAFSVVGVPVQAANPFEFPDARPIERAANPNNGDLPTMLGTGVKILLGIMGIFAFVLLILGGVKWMTAKDNEAGMKDAKDKIFMAAGGLILLFIAWPLSQYVIKLVVSMSE